MAAVRYDRRDFLAWFFGAVLLRAIGEHSSAQRSLDFPQTRHPEPRPGIDASGVLSRDQVTERPDAAPVFDMVRQIPQIVDGIRCHPGCDQLPHCYSLLSCYEGDGMAQHCDICQAQARLAYVMHRQGKTLGQIRAAIDASFG
jgi:hypothetical protein